MSDGACGDRSIDVTQRYIKPSKVSEIWAFRASGHQRRRGDLTVKYPLREQIDCPVRRVELPVWMS